MSRKAKYPSRTSVEVLQKLSAAPAVQQAIGRYVLGGKLLEVLPGLPELNNSLLSVYPVSNPVLAYVHADKLAILAQRGMTITDPRLKLPAGTNLPNPIRRPTDIFTAILASPLIDTSAASTQLSAPVLNVLGKRVFNSTSRYRYELELIVGDTPNAAYQDGFTIRGEKAVLGPLQQGSYSQAAIGPDGQPHHRLRIAEADIRGPQHEIKVMLCKNLARRLVGSEVQFGPLALGPAP